MKNIYTGKAAREFSRQGRLEEWIHRFLHSEGNNVEFSDGLKKERRKYIGPLQMPLNLFGRCCGPEENMKYRLDKEGFELRVSEIFKRLESGWSMPPLIINFSESAFTLTDGNHRYEAMLRLGLNESDVIIWTTGEDDYQQFIDEFSSYL